jgi:D-alanine-D-alanine ligase
MNHHAETQTMPALNKATPPTSLAVLEDKASHGTPIACKKIHKTIEIITIPPLLDRNAVHLNIGIELDAHLICNILSKVYQNVRITEINSQADLMGLATRHPDLVFSGVKYFDFENQQLWLNDYLDQHGIAYMASNRKALDGEFDKGNAKKLIQQAGIATADYFTTEPNEHPTEASIPGAFPLFVKPVSGGDSQGIDANSVVNDFASFQAKVADIWDTQNSRSLVETYLSGREYSVGIFEDFASGGVTAMPIEIIVQRNKNGQRILDYDTKRFDSEQVIAVKNPIIYTQLSKLAKAAFKVLDGKAFGRIDIKMNHYDIPHFMEANLMPGLRKGYFYRSCAMNLNLTYEQMILKIASNGLTSRQP